MLFQSKPSNRALKFAAEIGIAVALSMTFVTAPATATTYTVDARDNIYNATLNSPFPGFSPGLAPVPVTISPGQVISFSNITGAIDCCGGVPSTPPDGEIDCCSPTNLSAFNNISGIISNRRMFLAGVFGTAVAPAGPAPSTLSFAGAAAIDFANLSPDLWQAFFIGDGKKSDSTPQTFTAPALATVLYLGLADGIGFTGEPGAYDDNRGGFLVSLDDAAIVTPLPAALPLFGTGLGVMGLLGWRSKRKAAALAV